MMSRFAKVCLVFTSLAPVFLAIGVNQLAQDRYVEACKWFAGGALLSFVCTALLNVIKTRPASEEVAMKEIKGTDKDVLAFLLTYLLPLIAKNVINYTEDPMTAAFVFGIIFVTVYHSNAFHFNPVLGVLGYHFYEFRTEGSVPLMLISRRTIRRESQTVEAVHISDYIYFETTREQKA